MKIRFPDNSWIAVALSRELKKSPLRVLYQGVPVVLFRSKHHINALKDQCPHRGTPLSLGCIRQDTIICPYHGWQFNGTGTLVNMPGNPNFVASTKTTLQPFEAAEEAGLIWLRGKNDKEDYRFIPNIHTTHSLTTFRASINANIIDIAENFLDPLHTHFVHPGIIRFKSKERHNCKVTITNIENGYQATYIEDKRQSGIMSWLFGRHITKSVGRIRYPGIIEIEYYSLESIELAIVIYLSQEKDNRCQLILRSYVKKQKTPFFILAAILTPFQYLTFMQDKRLLEAIDKFKTEYPPAQSATTDCDIMRPYIEKALKK